MNEQIKKLILLSYDKAFDKCKNVEHTVSDNDNVFVGFAMNEMSKLMIEECIQKLVDHGYTDAADCLTKEMLNV